MDSKLKIEVLVASMHQKDYALPEKMNLQTDAVIGNQCEICSNTESYFSGKRYLYINRPDRGVGLNRNETIFHASGDILTFADDDMVFVENYEQLIQKAFNECPRANAIIFNITTLGEDLGRRQNSKIKRVHFWNALNYGTARISVKASSIRRENIAFHTCFGGGTRYSSGEDTLFIVDMLRHGLKIYTYPVTIASVDQTSSTWFRGYNEKYYYDKGALYRALTKHWAILLCLQELIRHPDYRRSGLRFCQAFRFMLDGIDGFRDLRPFDGHSKN